MRRTWCWLFVLTASPAWAQSDFWFSDELVPYRTLVDAYRSGGHATTVDEALSLEPDVVHALIDRVREPDRRLTGTDARPALAEQLFRGAAMLHLDAAEQVWLRGRERAANEQIELAVRWIEQISRDPEPTESFRRRWYRAVALLTFERGGWQGGVAFAEVALERLSDDVALLTTSAWLYEGFALAPVVLDGTGEGQLPALQERKRLRLLTAARRARAAWQRSPDAVEAGLRLARVRMLLGLGDSVRALLEEIVGRPDIGVEQAYLGRLLLAEQLAGAGDTEEAERLLWEATDLLPDGQSARVALARMLDRGGARRQAAAVLDPFLVASATRGLPDPWVDYRLGVGAGPELRAELRVEVGP